MGSLLAHLSGQLDPEDRARQARARQELYDQADAMGDAVKVTHHDTVAV